MSPREHLEWFEDNIGWFCALSPSDLARQVPSCPGWTVEHVVNHLAFGLGAAYPVAITKPADTPSDRVFAGVERPEKLPSGGAALTAFARTMADCLGGFRAADPSETCWTYAGAGTAAFWFRRAAIETSLHRMDVAEALGLPIEHLADNQAADAIHETLDVVLPLAATMTAAPLGQLVVHSPCLVGELHLGEGEPQVALGGAAHDVLNALWGRHRERVDVSGRRKNVSSWLALIETAFAGR